MINYICLTFQAACHLAICRPACLVQCAVFTGPLWLSEHRERETLFSCFSRRLQAFFSSFKWTVDEVSLIRLSQLALASAVCFPPKSVLTSPILFLYPSLCTFHPGFHPKTPFQQRSQWTPL